MPVITLEQTVFGYDSRHPLARCQNLKLEMGQIRPLVGSNGCGKTTVLLTIARLLPVLGGQVSCPRKVLFIPAKSQLFDPLTTQEHLSLATASHREAKTLIKQLGLESCLSVPYSQLSAGQKKCLSLAVAFLQRPQLLLIDEPSAELEPDRIEAIHRIFYDLTQKGCTCVFSTHLNGDLRYEQVWAIDKGQLLEQDTRAPTQKVSDAKILDTV